MTEETVARHKNARNDLTAEYVRSILDYDPETGEFRWKYRPSHPKKWNTQNAGKIAGTISDYRGTIRRQIVIDSTMYKAHRIAWLHFYGEWPKNQIDHIDCDATNNRISNLRDCTHIQNSSNTRGKSRNNLPKGVDYRKSRKKYRSRISVSGIHISLGHFDTPEDAHAAYCAAVGKLHGEFSRTE